MPDDETQEVPLPEGTIPDQESVTTQEIPVAREPFPEIQLVSPVKVELPPLHLMNDPIMTMDAPVADDTCLYDQLNPPAQTPLPKRPRRRMQAGDKFLAGMGVAALVMGAGVYGMVVEGWGAGEVPSEAKPEHSVTTTVSDEPTVLPTSRPQPTHEESRAPVRIVSAPTSYSPAPEHTITVVSPTPSEVTSAPETPEGTSEAPEPSPVHTEPSTPPPSPEPTQESPSPTQSSSSPSFGITLPASPTLE